MFTIELKPVGSDHWSFEARAFYPKQAYQIASKVVKGWLRRGVSVEEAEARTRILGEDGKEWHGE